jgi:hypothetical protein
LDGGEPMLRFKEPVSLLVLDWGVTGSSKGAKAS